MRDFSIVKQRILQVLDNQGLSKYEFYQKTGVSNGILSQKNGMTEENILKFLSVFPYVDANWLLKGEGNMYKSEPDESLMQAAEEPLQYEKKLDRMEEVIARLEKLEKRYERDLAKSSKTRSA